MSPLLSAAGIASLATCLLVGCGGAPPPATINAANALNNGSMVITIAGTYHYSLRTGCRYVKLSGDGGQADWLGSTGTLYLTVGNWSGSCYSPTFLAGICPTAPPALIPPLPMPCPSRRGPYQAYAGVWDLTLSQPG